MTRTNTQTHPPTKAIPRFIQMDMPLALLSPMAQSGHGVTQIVEVHMPLSLVTI
ncbi:hypothetical protein BAZSYMA_ACONTIG106775_1 [Bathymodiolus azoricus thioautotrophic gill symbiont]|uniref:Uncharacterized protein n=1 Tax=Bathymodiolus azoricus thioautotrophic gill symbiont TaxID=235205 RepID=A0A1H6JC85_9GAMM|nr:hypothetical protein BAZSYMA_ACONTIG106775_1 [Bathymodiolus azoricus thioautotrophic gill symbiont]